MRERTFRSLAPASCCRRRTAYISRQLGVEGGRGEHQGELIGSDSHLSGGQPVAATSILAPMEGSKLEGAHHIRSTPEFAALPPRAYARGGPEAVTSRV